MIGLLTQWKASAAHFICTKVPLQVLDKHRFACE